MGMFDDAAASRTSATKATESKLKKQSKPVSNKLTKLTLSVSEEDRQKAKIYAAQNNTSVSAMFHNMIESL